MRNWLILGMISMTAIVHAPSSTLPKIDPSQAVWLGSAHTLRAGGRASYTRRSSFKRGDCIRIGIFGPSIATTSEVGRAEDVPSHLQNLFGKAGHANVEVLGFGLGSASLQYSYLLWKAIGRHMQLDHVVVVLPKVYPWRETHFRGNAGIHGRLVLSGDGLKAIRPAGDTPEAAARIYDALVPVWNYWRYDNRVPPLLRRLFPDMATNPFYYQADPDKEAEEVVARLLEQWAKESPLLSVYFARQGIPTLEARLTKANIPFLKSQLEPLPEMYRSSAIHLSSLGNHARARELFHYLLGEESFSIPFLEGELARIPFKAGPWPDAQKPWYVFAGNSPLGVLAPPARPTHAAPAALVALSPFRYVELDAPLKQDLPAEIVIAAPGKRLRFPIGRVRRDSASLGVLIPLDQDELVLPAGRLHFKDGFTFSAREKFLKVWLTIGKKSFPLENQSSWGTPLWNSAPIAWNFLGGALPLSPPASSQAIHTGIRIGKEVIPLPLQVRFVPRDFTLYHHPYPYPIVPSRVLSSKP